MKKAKKIMVSVFVLVFLFTVMMSSVVLAAPGNDKGNGKNTATEEKVKGNEKVKEEVDSSAETEEEKAVNEKDKVMTQKKALMKQLIEARKSGNEAVEEDLLVQIKGYKEQLKLMVKNCYTEEEMLQLLEAGEDIETIDPDLEIVPVEKIIAKGRSLKFDIPPVIKDGKVLVPVRAFSQAYGAEVLWNQEEHTVTIIKDDIEIVFKTDSSIIYVNGEETDLGMPVKSLNGRNVLPVGFLAEKLGLKAEVDPEDGTIEIEEEDEEAEDVEDAQTEDN